MLTVLLINQYSIRGKFSYKWWVPLRLPSICDQQFDLFDAMVVSKILVIGNMTTVISVIVSAIRCTRNFECSAKVYWGYSLAYV